MSADFGREPATQPDLATYIPLPPKEVDRMITRRKRGQRINGLEKKRKCGAKPKRKGRLQLQ